MYNILIINIKNESSHIAITAHISHMTIKLISSSIYTRKRIA